MNTGGVIGLGGIGGGVAQCLQRSGQLSAIYDVRAEAAANVPGAPPMSATPRDLAAASDCVLIAVLNGAGLMGFWPRKSPDRWLSCFPRSPWLIWKPRKSSALLKG